jgi:DNA-binding NarL/FixJ family response regulator
MKEVGDLLQVSARTLAFHKYTIMEQLGVKTSAELLQYALEHGMLKSSRESTPDSCCFLTVSEVY